MKKVKFEELGEYILCFNLEMKQINGSVSKGAMAL